jgi:hypothetical protein
MNDAIMFMSRRIIYWARWHINHANQIMPVIKSIILTNGAWVVLGWGCVIWCQ